MSKKIVEFKCANPACNMTLFNLKAVDYGTPIINVDDLLVCGGCGAISKVTLEGTKGLTPAELEELPDNERRDLEFAVRAVSKKRL